MLVPILLCLLALGQQPPRDAASVSSQTSGTIRGRVVGADTRAPIAWARVWVRDSDGGTFNVTVLTDERGRFEAHNLPPGEYRVTALPPANRARYLMSPHSRPIAVAAGDPSDLVELALPVAAAVSGRVLDEAGDPLARARIQLRRFGPGDSKPQPVGSGSSQTDDQGRFRVFGLEDGEYVVSAAADTMVSKGQDSPPPTYVETFYPSSTTIDEATRVQLKPGQDLDGIEITLIRTKVYRMSGTIFGPDGQPAGRVTASLLHVGGNGQEISVDAAGRFAASGLMPGTYDVSASGSSDGGARIFGRTRFTIADADVSDLIVTTNPGVDVRGRVVVSQEKGLPPPNVQVETTRVDADGKSSWIPARTPLNPDASFVLRWLFGPTIVRVRPTPPGWMLKAVLLNGEDITDKPVEFRDQDSGHLEVVLTRRASVVEGSVKDTRDRPVDDYAVVLFSSNRNDWIPDSTRTQVTYPRSDARFRFDHVRAGRYWMVAIPRDRAGGWVYLSSDLERLVDDATDVVVGDDDRRSFDLKLVTPRE